MTTSRYDKQPSVTVPGPHRVWKGPEAWREVDRHATDDGRRAPLVVVDTYPGVDLSELATAIRAALPHYAVINVEDAAARPIREIDALIAANLTKDRVFGVISHHTSGSSTSRPAGRHRRSVLTRTPRRC